MRSNTSSTDAGLVKRYSPACSVAPRRMARAIQERPGVPDHAGILEQRGHLLRAGAFGQIDESLLAEAAYSGV